MDPVSVQLHGPFDPFNPFDPFDRFDPFDPGIQRAAPVRCWPAKELLHHQGKPTC